MRDPLLLAEDLVVGYAGLVLGPLSFRLGAGEVVGLWGRNGSGKSTLLRAIAGQARVLAGRLVPATGLCLGWQLQSPTRLPQMPFTGREYLAFAGAADAALPQRLDALLDHRVDRFSGGQFQLLAVAAVLHGPAELVMLDEPTNSLDPETEAALVDLLRADQGDRGVLLVSHERHVLERACSRILELGV